MPGVDSWGRTFPHPHQDILTIGSLAQSMPPLKAAQTLLPRGMGRSYGDVCLNDGGALLQTDRLTKIIDFDFKTGKLRCESGVLLERILEVCVPKGWFLPVVPGTQCVTVGGAIANDVHGKNHHSAGSFGRHVLALELLRSDGTRRTCSPKNEAEWFSATIGGLGLTGLITWAEIQLRKIPGPDVDVENLRFESWEEFVALSQESDKDYDYTVAWMDGFYECRGVFMRGRHAASGSVLSRSYAPRVPSWCPNLLGSETLSKIFNRLYYQKAAKQNKTRVSYASFFFPLDVVRDWTYLYGPRGFFQYQCVVPLSAGRETLKAFAAGAKATGQTSRLTVLKLFGSLRSPGLMSFPREGMTVAMDFPNTGEPILRLMDQWDALVRKAGGAVYPAKDARMSADSFRAFFPQADQFVDFIDPKFSSGFWRRVMR